MTLDCRRWLELLDEAEAGRLDDLTTRLWQRHLAECQTCAAVLDVRRDLPASDPVDAPDLSAAVLDATTGPACGRAQAILSEGDDVGAAERELAAAHALHCDDCAGLASVLAWLPATLPDLAEAEPGEAFVYDVLRATGPSRARRRAGVLPRLRERAGAWWESQLRRPHFALEAAFAATLLVVLLCGTPLSPAREAPRHILATVQTGPTRALTLARDGAVALGARAEAELKDLSDRRDRTAPYRASLRRHGRALGSAVLVGDRAAAERGLDLLGADWLGLWRTWNAADSAGTEYDTTLEDDRDESGS